jgi:CubicO group peptidase (beta-lactamase class C family)
MAAGNADVLAGKLDSLLRGLAARRDVPHAVAAVESVDGSFRWTGAAGNAAPGGPPMRADTPFFIASVDKLFTAAAMLRFHEQGLLDLDEPAAAYLPSHAASGLHRLAGAGRTSAITVRQLLSHTSGLPDYLEDRPQGGRSLIERLFTEGDMAWTFEDAIAIVRRSRPHFPPQPPELARPRVRYSDTNYLLLHVILERLGGHPLHRVLDDLVFRPLGMTETWLPGHSEPADPLPPPAALWLDNRPLDLPLAIRSVRGVYSTVRDLLRFLRGLVAGGLFDEPATPALMQRRWNRFGLPLDAAALRSPGWPIEYGLGMMRFRLPRFLAPFHAAPAVVGHAGSTGSWLFHCPDLDALLAGTVDQASGGPIPFRFLPRVLRAIEQAPRGAFPRG